MIKHAGKSESVWMHRGDKASRPSLEANSTADVVVVGGGIAGLSTAYFLAKQGKSVVVLDDGPLGGGETERTSAHLVTALDTRYQDLEKHDGRRWRACRCR